MCTAAWVSSRRPARASIIRDARLLSIYEGTTAIQANDLVGCKTARDGGATAKALARQIEATETALLVCHHEAAHAMAKRLTAARQAFLDVVDFVVANARLQPERGVRRLGALPAVGRQPGGRLATRPVRCWSRNASWPPAMTPSSCATRSPWRASTPDMR